MAKRDYYEVLGLQKGASADDVKAAYRKAALKWHPDRWVSGTDAEKKTAEENFKEASEAYSILSDPDKKAKYDQFGFAGVEGAGTQDWSQGFGDLNDILNNLFGGAFGGGRGFGGFGGFGSGFGGGFGGGSGSASGPRTTRGRDIRIHVKLSLEEIANGCDKELKLKRKRVCPDCGGKGARSSSDIRTCPTCKGTGVVRQSVNSLFGRTITESVCPQCHGEGKIITNPCRSCGGTGLVEKFETIRVRIPAGVENGMQISVNGEGHSSPNGGPDGNLLIVVEEMQHPTLKRDGQNLFCTKTISITDAVFGCDIEIPGLDGPQRVRIDAGTQSGTVLKLRGKGIPSMNGFGRGDLYVKVFVWVPRKLDRRAREAFDALRGSESVRPDPNRDDRELFEKEAQFF